MDASLSLQPDDVGLILSYRCQCACRHCVYNCDPSWKGWISPDDVRRALEQLHTWLPDTQVHLSGGEPFLNFPLLLQSVETAVSLGVICYAETNAGWCIRPEHVYQRFSRLHQAGMSAILISCSPFHAESIPLKRTLLAIDVALKVFGPGQVVVYLPDWIEQIFRFGSHTPVALENYLRAYGARPAGLMFWEGYGLISGGRAGYQLGSLTERLPAEFFQNQDCRRDVLQTPHSHFDLYGNFFSGFCGGLTLGSWHEFGQVLDRNRQGQHTPLVQILIEEGPYGLYRLARRQYGYRPLPGGYAGKCHLCVDVRRCLHAAGSPGDFPELQPAEFYQHLP